MTFYVFDVWAVKYGIVFDRLDNNNQTLKMNSTSLWPFKGSQKC